jgi:hypothetical protein
MVFIEVTHHPVSAKGSSYRRLVEITVRTAMSAAEQAGLEVVVVAKVTIVAVR